MTEKAVNFGLVYPLPLNDFFAHSTFRGAGLTGYICIKTLTD